MGRTPHQPGKPQGLFGRGPAVQAPGGISDCPPGETDYMLEIPEIVGEKRAFLKLLYEGDRAELFDNGKMVADNFFDGTLWEIGLEDLENPRQLELRIYAMPETQAVYLEPWVVRPESEARIKKAELVLEYRYELYPKKEFKQD